MSNTGQQNFVADISACLLALCAALEKHNVLTNAQIREAAQERLLTLTVGRASGDATQYQLLRAMAVRLPAGPDEPTSPPR